MPSMLEKKVPPPPRQPGTHTNAEVKEALHARALRRTVVITAVLFLLLACLAVVSSTAQEYQGPENTTSAPKAIIVVTSALTPSATEKALLSNKAPFTRVLTSVGGIRGSLDAGHSPASHDANVQLVRLLTGNAESTSAALGPPHAPSFLKTLKEVGYKPVVVAPAAYWSDTAARQDTDAAKCARVGLLDMECSGTHCPQASAAAYCNAHRKYLSCDAAAQLHRDEVAHSLTRGLGDGGDVVYVQLDAFRAAPRATTSASGETRTVADEMQQLSQLNLLDAAVGQVALALEARTNATKENWLLMIVGDGANEAQQAPFMLAVYSRGGLVQLNAMPAGAKTTDVYPTLLKWFGQSLTSEQQARVLGICSDGIQVTNCPDKANGGH